MHIVLYCPLPVEGALSVDPFIYGSTLILTFEINLTIQRLLLKYKIVDLAP